ncbi:hypothetical protein [Absidia glauca]|uniref:Uncharacterized protein n=1 Tax=Absidia glauca TaxID=4829 RepID=A0A163IQC8_ABSGL|nr:hypothetical protein [Absidia glauca]
MGQRFRSLFKKKKNQEPSPPPPSAPQPYTNAPRSLLQTQLFSPSDDTLTFTHGSLLDDVLNGLKVHEPSHTKEVPTASRHLDPWVIKTETSAHQQQEQRDYQQQTMGGSSENNRTSIYQQNMVTQPSSSASCRPSPEACVPSPPTIPILAPASTPTPTPTPTPNTPMKATAATTPDVSLMSPPLTSSISNTPPARMNINNGHMPDASSPVTLGTNDSDISDGPSLGSDSMGKSRITATTASHRPSITKSPSIASSSLESNHHDKRHRSSLATPTTSVSMSRMKERHRQEYRRSLQSNPPESMYQTPPGLPASASYQSFQQSPLLVQQQKLNPMVQRPYQASLEPMMHTLQPSTSFSYLPPAPPPGNLVRSSSVMTDMYHLPPTMATAAPQHTDWAPHPSWRQQPLFPYQSDIILSPPPLSPLHQQQQQQPSMMMYPPLSQPPSSSSYRSISTIDTKMIPRSASVYSGTKQYNYQQGPLLRSSPITDYQPSSIQQQRKSMPVAVPRGYQPQLILSPDQQHQQSKKPKKQIVPATDSGTDSPPPSDPLLSESTASSSPVLQSSSTSTSLSTNTSNKEHQTSAKTPGDEEVTRSDASDIVNSCHSNTDSVNGGLDEKLEITTPLIEEPPTKGATTKPHHQRRFSLPTTFTVPAPAPAIWKHDDHAGESVTTVPAETPQLDQENQQRQQPPDQDHNAHAKVEVTCTHSHGWEAHPPHACGAWPSYALPSPPSCYGHHHHHHQPPPPHFMGHCGPPSPCCTPPPPPPPSCCSHHHRHHHHRPPRKQCHHHHTKLHMKKSTSMMVSKSLAAENDNDDAKTIGSATQSLAPPHKKPTGGQRSNNDSDDEEDDDDDDHTISGGPTTPTVIKPSTRRPSLRSLLPRRPPRFTTTLPPHVKQQKAKRLSPPLSWIRS